MKGCGSLDFVSLSSGPGMWTTAFKLSKTSLGLSPVKKMCGSLIVKRTISSARDLNGRS